MQCIDFRRRALADPADPGADVLAHAHACAGCARYLWSLRVHDARCQRALAVEAPTGLADRVLLRHHAQRRGGRLSMPFGLSAAAAFALLVVVLMLPSPLGREHAPDSVGRQMSPGAQEPVHASAGRAAIPGLGTTAPGQGSDGPVMSVETPVVVGSCSISVATGPSAPLPWSRSLSESRGGLLWSCPDCM